MADVSIRAQYPKWNIGGTTVLAASTGVTATTTGTALYVGKGLFRIAIVVDSIEIASNTETYGISVQSNSLAATSTWKECAQTMLGCLEYNGKGLDDTAGTYQLFFYNEADYQIRVVYTVGSGVAGTGLVCGLTVYPVATINA